MNKIPESYYTQNDTLWIARDLLGKFLFTQIGGESVRGGIITECEAYLGTSDRASHAWNNRKTKRTATMYLKGGTSYIYLCYGLHHLFNVVTGPVDVPHAVLIRGLLQTSVADPHEPSPPLKPPIHRDGPAKLTRALGITRNLNNTSLQGDIIWLEDRGLHINPKQIQTGPRIGIDYAGEDARLPYRFWIKNPVVTIDPRP